jgi:hypothetical protein
VPARPACDCSNCHRALAGARVDHADERRVPARARCRRRAARSLAAATASFGASAPTDRSWLIGFALESAGFALYVVALALAPLTLVQSISAGGIGILAFVSARMRRRRLGRHELAGVLVSMLGLLALAVSLAGGSGEGTGGSTFEILLWLGAMVAAAVVALGLGRRFGELAVAEGIAGGLFFSIGDISVKVATQGGARTAFAIGVIVGYSLGTAFLQLGYQKGGALTVAGLATLLTNALPIAAGTVVLGEPVPSGVFGALRIVAFAAVTIGAILLARPDQEHPQR